MPGIKENPVLGIGYGERVAPVSDPRAYHEGGALAEETKGVEVRMEAHNVWLNVLGQAGVIGLIGFTLLMWWVVGGVRNAPLGAPFQNVPIAVFAAVAGAFLFHGLFLANEEARHLWVLFAIAASIKSMAPTSKKAASQPSA